MIYYFKLIKLRFLQGVLKLNIDCKNMMELNFGIDARDTRYFFYKRNKCVFLHFSKARVQHYDNVYRIQTESDQIWY